MTASIPITTDVAIIGAGPVGLFAVFECGQLDMCCHVIDCLSDIGGQCQALYPEKPIYDIPGHPQISGDGLVKSLAKQIAPYQPGFTLGTQVIAIEITQDRHIMLTTSNQTKIKARAVIIAAGGGAFAPNRPPLEGVKDYEGKSIFYAVQQPDTFKDKRVVIMGGGDSALDWAINLSNVARQVTLVHRRRKFRSAPASVVKMEELVKNGDLSLITPYHLAGIDGNNGQITRIHLRTLDDQRHSIKADVLLLFFGLKASLGPIAEWNLAMTAQRLKVNPRTCATSIPGVFAIGDVIDYPGKLKLILTGFAEAAHAAHAIFPMVFPDKTLNFQYSTTKGTPKY